MSTNSNDTYQLLLEKIKTNPDLSYKPFLDEICYQLLSRHTLSPQEKFKLFDAMDTKAFSQKLDNSYTLAHHILAINRQNSNNQNHSDPVRHEQFVYLFKKVPKEHPDRFTFLKNLITENQNYFINLKGVDCMKIFEHFKLFNSPNDLFEIASLITKYNHFSQLFFSQKDLMQIFNQVDPLKHNNQKDNIAMQIAASNKNQGLNLTPDMLFSIFIKSDLNYKNADDVDFAYCILANQFNECLNLSSEQLLKIYQKSEKSPHFLNVNFPVLLSKYNQKFNLNFSFDTLYSFFKISNLHKGALLRSIIDNNSTQNLGFDFNSFKVLIQELSDKYKDVHLALYYLKHSSKIDLSLIEIDKIVNFKNNEREIRSFLKPNHPLYVFKDSEYLLKKLDTVIEKLEFNTVDIPKPPSIRLL